ncbi:MAG: TonB-dependent receptor [Burkholderiales bacterium]|nr:TonB-dependent receptor [Burkholderiales bacterium]
MPTPAHLANVAVAASMLLGACPVRAGTQGVADLSLEDLLKTEVVTVSKRSQSLQSTAAAAFVITREDIERSGATSIPEALRLAPGVEVARIANNHWAVTVRGFNGRFANKLLVLMDGRSIYSPLFSGVLWEFEDTLLEDVERIEVIRGPGAALWGANAVNGVINIITRKARDTQGDLLVGGAGTLERGFAAYRHGGKTADGYYRVWAKAFDRGPSETLTGAAGNDYWRSLRAGFRLDASLASANHYTISGEAYGSPTGDRWNLADVTSPTGYTTTAMKATGQGGHLLGRYEWRLDNGSDAAFQSYLDYGDVNVFNALHQKRTTVDLDYQLRSVLDARNDFIWGLGYRYSRDSIDTIGLFSIEPQQRGVVLFNAFVQDEFTVVPERLRVIAGARLEHNSYTGLEPQPNLRMVWTPSPSQSVWGAVSHAVRTPSRAERDAQVDLFVTPANPPYVPLPVLTHSDASNGGLAKSEKVNTFELGYRQQAGANLSVDMTAFYSRYTDLRTAALGAQSLVMGPTPYILQTIHTVNGIDARTHGLELAVDWHPLPWWRLQPTYTYFRISGSSTSADPVTQADAARVGASSPRHRWSLRSSFTPDARQQFDLWLRHAGALATINELGNSIPSYTTLDLRYAWRPMSALELSIVGQNLLHNGHTEFVPDLLPSQSLVVQRSVYVKATYRF